MCAYLLIWNSFDELGTLLGIPPHKVCFYLQLLAFVVNLSIVLFHVHVQRAEVCFSLQAEKIASRMIYEDRMKGSIDQVDVHWDAVCHNCSHAFLWNNSL